MQDMHETLDQLVGKRFYWSVDISSYYWQIELADESKELTAFVIPGGQKFQFTRVPFGLRSAPAWAQQQLKETLQADPTTAKLTNYLDDINFGSNDADECVQQFEDLLKFCIKHNIKLKREKCALGVPAIKALGCVVNAAGKWIDPDRVLALLKVPPARCVKELKSLLGSFGFVRQWLCHAATICAPLTDLLRKNSKFTWGPAQDAALEALKREVESSTCLGQLDPKLPIYIRPDASNIGCAAVLFQMVKVVEDGVEKERPRAIAYTSRRFSPAEMRWSTAEGEAFAIKHAFCRFQSLIQGLPVIVESDHANHRFLYNAKTSAKIQRWRMFLEQFDYEVRHLPGKKNEISDGLSRLHMRNLMLTAPTNKEAEVERTKGIITSGTYVEGVPEISEPITCEDPDEDDSKGEGGLDEALFQLMQGGPTSEVFEIEPTKEASDKAVEAEWQELEEQEEVVEEGEDDADQRELETMYGKGAKLLKLGEGRMMVASSPQPWDINRARIGREDRRGIGVGEESNRKHHDGAQLNVEVAQEVADVIRSHIKQVHNDRVGHMGKLRTYRRLRQLPGFPWGQPTEALHAGVKEWCEGCLPCQKIWSLRGRPGAPGAAVIRQRPFTEVSLDLVVLKRVDRDGNRYLLNIMDSFSRFSELFPLKTGDAESVAECLFAVYNRYGRPRVMRADGAKAFHGSVLTALNRMLGVENHVTLAYSPYQNGQNERQNQEIGRHLRAMVMGDVLGVNSMLRWGTLTSAVQRILNNTVHGDLMCTPNELLLGGYSDSDMAMFQDDHAVGENEAVVAGEYVHELEETQFRLLTLSELHQERRLEQAAEKARVAGQRQIEEGEYVLALRGGMGGRPKEKLQCKYTGPYLVVQRPDPTHSVVKCLHLATRELVEFHMDILQVCNMSHFREDAEAAAKFAERDDWTYTVDRILQHRPTGPRRKRAKHLYEFEVLYKHIPRSTEPGDENPCFQPWENIRYTTALKEYCQQPAVVAELGPKFYVSDEGED
jgi:transposase InsO family protein